MEQLLQRGAILLQTGQVLQGGKALIEGRTASRFCKVEQELL